MLIISANPCFDATFWVPDLIPGSVIRSIKNTYTPGSKGINVARVRKIMGVTETRLAVMVPEIEGQLFKELLDKEELNASYLDIAGTVRQAILINKEGTSDSTVLVGKSSELSSEDWNRFCSFIKDLIKPDELVTLMGSLPINSPSNALEQMANIVHKIGAIFLVDTSPASMKTHGSSVLDIISPNLDEAESLINSSSNAISSSDGPKIKERALLAAERLQGKVAKIALVTAGEHGVAVKSDTEHFFIEAYALSKAQFKSSVGAGDSFVAGFSIQYEKDESDLKTAIKFGMACAAAQCETYEPGNLVKNRALEIFEKGHA